MSRAARLLLTLASLGAVGAGGFWIGRHGVTVAPDLVARMPALAAWLDQVRLGAAPAAVPAKPSPTGPVAYYQDPDGKPFYSAHPKITPDGRAWRAVHASEDVNFGGAPQTPPATAAREGGRRVLYYRHPMGLPDTSPVPKKDSMGMDYIPVYAGEDSDGSTVTIAPGKLQRTGVASEPVERRVLAAPIRAPGVVQQDERRLSVVAMRSEAWIEKVENVTTGDHVHKGQPLMRVYSPAIAGTAAEYAASLSPGGAGSAPGYTRGSRQRLVNLAVPEPVIAAIEKTREAPLALMWPAPRDGVVIERNVTDGMRVMPGDVLFRVADHSVVWVVADVSERDLAPVAVGQPVSIRARSFPGTVLTGRVALIYPHLNPQTRTARVRMEIANPNGILRPDMYADVEIDTGSGAPVLAVPNSAVIDSGDRQVVIVDKGEGRFEPRPVQLGRRGAGYVEIRDGVKGGERVVTTANFLIDAESNLKAALRGLAAAEQPQ